MFGISIFESPEHFIALHLGLFKHTEKALPHLGNLLRRTKNPPISALYTYEFLQERSDDEISLNIIRYLSQLSDLSAGTSMSTSLHGVISESSFLTEIRHNLTHKIKISQNLLKTARTLIIQELRSKFWMATYQKYMDTYDIDVDMVCQQYQKIYEDILDKEEIDGVHRDKKAVTADWLKEAGNYEFKEFYPGFYNHSAEGVVLGLLGELSAHKKAIAISYNLSLFCLKNKDQKLCQFLMKALKQEPSVLGESLVARNLRKLTFMHNLGLCSKVIGSLPEKICQQLSKYWVNKQQGLTTSNSKLKIITPYLYRK